MVLLGWNTLIPAGSRRALGLAACEGILITLLAVLLAVLFLTSVASRPKASCILTAVSLFLFSRSIISQSIPAVGTVSAYKCQHKF